MKIRIDRDALTAGLKQVAPALNKGATHRILTGVRITHSGDGLELCCSDLSLTVTAGVQGSIDAGGPIVVPAGPLERIVKALPQGAVEMVVDDSERMQIASGDTTATLHLFDPGSWPAARDRVDVNPVTLTARDLHQIGRLIPFASIEEKGGGLLAVWMSGCEAMTADRYRGGIAVLDSVLPWTAQVPAETLRQLIKQADGPVTMAADEWAARFTVGATSWCVSLIEEAFPADRMPGLFPVDPPHRWTFEPLAFAEALGRAQSIGSAGDIVSIRVDGQRATVSRGQDGVGEIADSIPVESNWSAVVGFNPDKLADAVAMAETDELTLHLVDELKPVTIYSDRFRQLIMPIRVPEVKR